MDDNSSTSLSSIQAAIDSSNNEDIVLVYPGTYAENINLRGKAIHLVSQTGPETTILDGSQGDSSVVVCNNGEDNRTVIEGFTITGGKGTLLTPNNRGGGGILCISAAPIIRNNILQNNTAMSPPTVGHGSSSGGAFLVGGPNVPEVLIFEHNRILGNSAQVNGAGGWISGPCIFRNNLVSGNHTLFGDGGGLYVSPTQGQRIELDGNLFLANNAGDHGGGIYAAGRLDPSLIDIHDNIIIGNTSATTLATDCSGGGTWITFGAHFHNNTIAFNQAEAVTFPAGGGLCLFETVDGTVIARNIFYHNSQGGIALSGAGPDPRAALITENLLFDNGYQDLFIPDSGYAATLENNLFLDPLFCETGPESRGELAAASPALHQSFGVIGAVRFGTCGPYVEALKTTWGQLKSRYRNKN